MQALAFLSSTGSLPVLVIPPAHLTRNWQEETLRFLRVDGRWLYADGDAVLVKGSNGSGAWRLADHLKEVRGA